MAQLNEIVNYLDKTLNNSTFKDFAINGLQVDSQKSEITKIAYAVDAGESIIDSAISAKADLLIVHHGLFWGQGVKSITDILGRKIAKLVNAGCSLYASHLPLDAHIEYGNNAQIAKILKLSNINTFANLDGQNIGVYGELQVEHSLEEIFEYLKDFPGILKEPLKLNFTNKKNKKIGIVSGSGSSAIDECNKLRIDCLISGESKQEVYHSAKELNVNCLFIGHYGSETFGVTALSSLLKDKYNLQTSFIDEPTGI